MKHKKILIIIAIELVIIGVMYFGFIRGKSDDKKEVDYIVPGTSSERILDPQCYLACAVAQEQVNNDGRDSEQRH